MTNQRPLFDGPNDPFDTTRDPRLRRQIARVYMVLYHRPNCTLAEISSLTGDPQSSISARIRDLRKPRFGGFTINTALIASSNGQYSYTLIHDSGDPRLVFDPDPNTPSPKAEARKDIEDWLETHWVPAHIERALNELLQ